jgi:hypothetical protein
MTTVRAMRVVRGKQLVTLSRAETDVLMNP